MSHRHKLPTALLLAVLCLLPATFAAAQDKDLSELEHYTLTMEKVTRYQHFYLDAAAYEKAHPESKPDIDDAIVTDADKHQSTDQIANRLNGHPAISQMLKQNGWTPHDFVVCQFTLIQSGLAVAMKPANRTDAQYAAEVHVNPANLAFMREHRAEIQAMMRPPHAQHEE